MIGNVLTVAALVWVLCTIGLLCMVAACWLIDRDVDLPIPYFPPEFVGGCECHPADGVYDWAEDEAQRAAVLSEIEAWWALPPAVNR
jgi:hypothetical protein